MSLVILQEAVVVSTIVAQEELAVIAVQHCTMSFVSVLPTIVAAMLFLSTSNWKVRGAEALRWW